MFACCVTRKWVFFIFWKKVKSHCSEVSKCRKMLQKNVFFKFLFFFHDFCRFTTRKAAFKFIQNDKFTQNAFSVHRKQRISTSCRISVYGGTVPVCYNILVIPESAPGWSLTSTKTPPWFFPYIKDFTHLVDLHYRLLRNIGLLTVYLEIELDIPVIQVML